MTCDHHKSFDVGDYVSRDGTDIHEILSLTDDKESGEFKCVKAPDTPWIAVGETEYNMSWNYTLIEKRKNL